MYFLSFISFSMAWVLSSSHSSDEVSGGFIGFNTVSQMPLKRSDFTAVPVYDSFIEPRIYLFGGCISDQICHFDTAKNMSAGCYCSETTSICDYYLPETDVWSTNCASAPVQRYRHAWAKVNDLIYLAGGRDVADNLIQTIDIYNPVTNTWGTSLSWPNATSDLVAFGHGSNLFLVGGYNQNYDALATVARYNTIDQTWNYDVPDMNYERGDTQIQEYLGSFYVVGGYQVFTFNTTIGRCQPPTKYIEKYNPATNAWTVEADMLYGRSDTAVGVLDNDMFVIGGEMSQVSDKSCTHAVPIKNVTRFDTTSNIWHEEDNIDNHRFRFNAVSYTASHNSSSFSAIFLFGGQTTYDTSSDSYIILNTTTLYVPITYYYNHHHQKKLSGGEIAGIVIGVVVGVVGALIIIFGGYCARVRYLKYYSIDDNKAALNGHNIDSAV